MMTLAYESIATKIKPSSTGLNKAFDGNLISLRLQ